MKYLILFAILINLVSALIPITLDESYYYLWSQHLGFGYFDHPPFVAWLASLTPNFLLPYIGPRLGTLLLSLATLALAIKFFKTLGMRHQESFLLSLVLFKFNLGNFGASILTTPDVSLIFFWLLALHECYLALTKNPRRWLTAGIATGLGLLSKYSMLLIGLVFLISLFLIRKKDFRRPWPYLGGLLAFLILLPNLVWNSQNNWISFGFQLRRLAPSAMVQTTDLPKPQALLKGSAEDLLMQTIREEVMEEIKAPRSKIQIPAPLQRFLDFVGGVLVLWGLLLLPLIFLFKRKYRKTNLRPLKREARILLSAAVLVPLLVFGLVSFFTKIEANWSAIYMMALIPLLYPYLEKIKKGIVIAACLQGILVLVLSVHIFHPFLPLKKDRLLKETQGYYDLAISLEGIAKPIFADTYQLTSMLRYYSPEKNIRQWPNMNRPSELTRDSSYSASLSEIQDGFYLITSDKEIPHFDSFKPISLKAIHSGPHTWLLVSYFR